MRHGGSLATEAELAVCPGSPSRWVQFVVDPLPVEGHELPVRLRRQLTHQGGLPLQHLDDYLDEFTFRFNRRRASQRGLLFYRLLELALPTKPITYDTLV